MLLVTLCNKVLLRCNTVQLQVITNCCLVVSYFGHFYGTMSKQAEAEVVPSSSLVELKVEVEVGVEVWG